MAEFGRPIIYSGWLGLEFLTSSQPVIRAQKRTKWRKEICVSNCAHLWQFLLIKVDYKNAVRQHTGRLFRCEKSNQKSNQTGPPKNGVDDGEGYELGLARNQVGGGGGGGGGDAVGQQMRTSQTQSTLYGCCCCCCCCWTEINSRGRGTARRCPGNVGIPSWNGRAKKRRKIEKKQPFCSSSISANPFLKSKLLPGISLRFKSKFDVWK